MEKFIMKKQIIAAAVAASVSAVALADISITGSAKYEYLYTEYSDATESKNESATEMKLAISGKNGDTGAFIGIELDGSNETDNDNTQKIDVEDMYLTTKVGDINVKAGNWASGTTALMGEIDNGPRSHGKVDFSTTVGGVKVYAGNAGGADSAAAEGFATISEDMYAGVSFNVAGATVQAKHVSATEDHFGIAGDLNGIKYRVETKSVDTANSDVLFAEVGTTVGGMGVSYAMIDADAGSLVSENDSAIFAKEMGLLDAAGSTEDGQQQITVSTSVDGNSVTLKAGSIDNAFGAGLDQDYTQINVSRPLASGATATITYTDYDSSSTVQTETFEIDLSVSF
jgi:hypothetical protein